MANSTFCQYRDVSERDMDMVFIEAFATDPEFLALFINKTEIAGKPCKLVSAERSKIDYGLGESDITVKKHNKGLTVLQRDENKQVFDLT